MSQGRVLVIGDIHGSYKALLQVLERADFDPFNDILISLGDVADGWPQTKECIEHLLTFPNFFAMIGNHDEWALEWMETGKRKNLWISQGGRATIESYGQYHDPTVWKRVPNRHVEYLRNALPYYIDEERNFCFVHGGWPWGNSPEEHESDVLWWDRSLWAKARTLQTQITRFDRVFLGHTAVSKEPVKCGEIWNLDTGAGWNGVLTVMDVDTEEYWQSDLVPELYPNYTGRR